MTKSVPNECTTVAWNIATEAIDNWEEYVIAPTAPKNYKDPVKIEAYIDAAIDQSRQEAHKRVVTGKVTQVEMMRNGEVIKCDIDDPRVYEALSGTEVTHIGLGIKAQLRILAMNFIVKGKPINLRYLLSNCYDPMALLLGSSEIGTVSFTLLLKRIFGEIPHGQTTENLVELWKLYE